MKFVSLFTRRAQFFSKSISEVILLQDVEGLGFEGQIVKVQPGYAFNVLIKKHKAVYNFPFMRERIFPDITDEHIEKRIFDANLIKFKKKLEDLTISVIKEPSATNPDLLKTPLSVKDLLPELRKRGKVNPEPAQVKIDQEIISYGKYNVRVENYHDDYYNLRLNFKFRVEVRRAEHKQAESKQPLDLATLTRKKTAPGAAKQEGEGGEKSAQATKKETKKKEKGKKKDCLLYTSPSPRDS
eukprot:TRINITY_DN7457_c0_g1_i6.p1 TRINITY_DN7457_c0_g1~~TRINITY_DN7457_c0_g1_i6.p1  ORF type:complete len:241 (+),score=75.35 TRINITY_DN7457_c0_g1_i6:125-847(+)